MIEDSKLDSSVDYMTHLQQDEKAVLQKVESTTDPENTYVCALCRNNDARKLTERRISCQLPGCLDLDLKIADATRQISVESIMNKVYLLIRDHKNCEGSPRLDIVAVDVENTGFYELAQDQDALEPGH